MKPTAALLLLFIILPTPVTAEESHSRKRDLVRELMKVLDAKLLTQSMMDAMFGRDDTPRNAEALAHLPPEQRKIVEDRLAERSKEQQEFRDQLFARIDYATFAEKTYAPVIDATFTEEQLENTISFFRTPEGRKVERVFFEMMSGMTRNASLLSDTIAAVSKDVDAAREEKMSAEERTMNAMRAIAIAAEAYASDANRYPVTDSLSALESLVSPAYLKNFPQKDGWGTSFAYIASPNGDHYRIVSAGPDGQFSWRSREIDSTAGGSVARVADSPDGDFIFQDGAFIRFPAGLSKDQ
jgi:hypothetical protein